MSVRVTTPDGTSANTSADDFTYESSVARPKVTDLSPDRGTIDGGTVVTITGANFVNVTAVMFGTYAATDFTVDSDTQITATAPAHAAGSVSVRVTADGGTSANTSAANFRYVSRLLDLIMGFFGWI